MYLQELLKINRKQPLKESHIKVSDVKNPFFKSWKVNLDHYFFISFGTNFKVLCETSSSCQKNNCLT